MSRIRALMFSTLLIAAVVGVPLAFVLSRPSNDQAEQEAPANERGPFLATIEGDVSDGMRAIPGATIRYDPQGVVVRSDFRGRFRVVLRLTRRCQLLKVTVTAPGYGKYEEFLSPIYSVPGASNHSFHLSGSDTKSTVGPPLADPGACGF